MRKFVQIRKGPGGPAKVGQKLQEGAELRSGKDGIIVLYRDKISMVTLDVNSEMQVKSLQGTKEKPVTELFLVKDAAALVHKGKLPKSNSNKKVE